MRRLSVLSALLAVACGGAAAVTPASTPGTVATGAGAIANGNGNGGSASDGGEVVLAARSTGIAPGFSPAPLLFRGRSGGPIDATTRDPYCYGYAPVAPQHTLTVTSPFSSLVVAAHAGGADILIHMLLPDGSWRCNDDWDGLSPRVDGPVGVGRVQIFVGAFVTNAQDASNYVLAVSEDSGLMPSSLPFP